MLLIFGANLFSEKGCSKKVNSQQNENTMRRLVLFEDSMKVNLPADTEIASEEIVSQMYPYTRRPHIILCSGHDYFTFSLYSKSLNSENLNGAILSVKDTIEKTRPACIIEDIKIERYNKRSYGWFSYRPPADNNEYYSIMYVTPINGNFMLGTYTCKMDDEKSQSNFVNLVRSIQSMEDTDGN